MKVRKLSCCHKIIDPERGVREYMKILINHVKNCEKAKEILIKSRSQ